MATEEAGRRRLLLVNDQGDIRQLLRLMAQRDGAFEIVGEAGDGDEAVEVAARVRPDVILLDVSMPRRDGVEAVPGLRKAAP